MGAPTKSSSALTSTFHAFTLGPALIAAAVLTFALFSINELFKQFMKTYLENQNQNQALFLILKKALDRLLKAKNL